MHATNVLAAQHQAIAALFESVEREVELYAREGAVGRLAEELIAHMAGEETVFYPALRRMLGSDEQATARAYDEHVTLRLQLRRVLAGSLEDAAFDARIAALRAIFERHVLEEETRLFPHVERALQKVDQEVLGAQILACRPPIWMVTTERAAARRAGTSVHVASRVSLPIPAARG
jgi:iron-sulfur cluster repair protein YtfE (RIC family)